MLESHHYSKNIAEANAKNTCFAGVKAPTTTDFRGEFSMLILQSRNDCKLTLDDMPLVFVVHGTKSPANKF